MVLIVLALGAVVLVYVYKRIVFDYLPKHNMIALTGSLGTGKSMLGSLLAVRKLKRSLIKYYWQKLTKHNLAPEEKLFKPRLFSNYKIFMKRHIVEMSAFDVLNYEGFNRGDVIVLDELSNDKRFNQWAKNEQVEKLDVFFRNSRKAGLYVVIMDQSILNLNYSIKRRANFIVNLNEFRRFFSDITIKYQTYQMLDGNTLMEYEPKRNKSNMLLNKKYKFRLFRKYDTNEFIGG